MNDKHYLGKPCVNGHDGTRYKSNGMCVRCSNRRSVEWQKKNPEATRAIKQRTRAKHRQSDREYALRYYEENLKDSAEYKRKKAAYDREYRRKNKERLAAVKAEWRAKNADLIREVKRSHKHRRRAVKRDGMSGAELAAWVQKTPKRCYWCGESCGDDFHVDHYKPLARGGRHEEDNLVMSCPTCNLQKSAKHPYEFAAEVGRLF